MLSLKKISVFVMLGTLGTEIGWAQSTSEVKQFHGKIVDAKQAPETYANRPESRPGYGAAISYAYGPSIVKEGSTFHVFFCAGSVQHPNSFQNGGWDGGAWDQIMYTKKVGTNGWTRPEIVLYPSLYSEYGHPENVLNPFSERSNCDPSLVFFNGYYYLYYSGNTEDVRTAIYVARSQNIAGPYYKYRGNNSWAINATDPKRLFDPMHFDPPAYKIIFKPCAVNPPREPDCEVEDRLHVYGAGQQEVVNKGDGNLYMWYTDDTALRTGVNQGLATIIVMRKSTDGINWSAPTITQCPQCPGDNKAIDANSVSVKFDAVKNMFVMYDIENDHRYNTYLTRRYSNDGIYWTPPETVINEFAFPNYAHNVGVSGNREGKIENFPAESILVAYGSGWTEDVSSESYSISTDGNFDLKFCQDDAACATRLRDCESDAYCKTALAAGVTRGFKYREPPMLLTFPPFVSSGPWDLIGHTLGGSPVVPEGIFANSNATWYSKSSDKSYCGLNTPAKVQLFPYSVPSLGSISRTAVGTNTGICQFNPARKYFTWNGQQYFSTGDGSYCKLGSSSSAMEHNFYRNEGTNFSAMNIGALNSDPAAFMNFSGNCDVNYQPHQAAQFTCDASNRAQQWIYANANMVNIRLNGCLDIIGSSPGVGARAGLYYCVYNQWQRWSLPNEMLQNAQSGLCLDIEVGGTAGLQDGVGVIQTPCVGNNWQKWNLIGIGSGMFLMQNKQSGKCLDWK